MDDDQELPRAVAAEIAAQTQAVGLALSLVLERLDEAAPGLKAEVAAELARRRSLVVEHSSGDFTGRVAEHLSMLLLYLRPK